MKLSVLIPRFDPAHPRSAIENMKLLADEADGDLLAFIHSDVTIHDEDWQEQVVAHFKSHEKCGLVGFGGALGLGTRDIYRTPYRLQQLARIEYYSNQDDWEVHGRHLMEARRVTMLDGFALIFRRADYENAGGWEAALSLGLSFHMYDFWACCRVHELGREVWALPVSCAHHGGGVSVSKEYDQWLRSQGIDGDSEIHRKAHEICYERFRNVLPWRLK